MQEERHHKVRVLRVCVLAVVYTCTVALDMHNDMLHIIHCLGETTQSKFWLDLTVFVYSCIHFIPVILYVCCISVFVA